MVCSAGIIMVHKDGGGPSLKFVLGFGVGHVIHLTHLIHFISTSPQMNQGFSGGSSQRMLCGSIRHVMAII